MPLQNNSMVWIVDDDESIRWVFAQALKHEQINTRQFSSADNAIEMFEHEKPALIITDIRMEGRSGLEFLDLVQKRYPNLPVIVTTAYSDLDTTVESFQKGAREHLAKPFDIDVAVTLVQRVLQEVNGEPQRESNSEPTETTMIGESAAMKELFRAIGRLSTSDLNVLITGETGTGKELVARALYRNSVRRDQVFVAINAAAIPADLLESELFGHEKGAFTGANLRRIGRFEQADKGTLFLDEIGDMPHDLQSRLLRVMSEGKFYRVGGTSEISVDVRIIAATNQNLEALVKKHAFRADLYHRLNVVRIALAPLRARPDDIPLLINHFMKRAAEQLNTKPKALSVEVMEYLIEYGWPGNVREVENLCRSLTIMSPAKVVMLEDLPAVLGEYQQADNAPLEPETLLQSAMMQMMQNSQNTKDGELRESVERILLRSALEFTEGSKHKTAEILGWGRNTIARKAKDL